ncbi:MAG: helix-turn-helix domain-containing protein [Chloroflexia bacterium]|nr:helix-turn-helix domain-containing protein [Chloroflexia bacterium]
MDLTRESIKALRRRLGLTQPQFAARIGCTAQAVSYWERGARTPTGLYAQAIRRLMAETAALTSVPPDESRPVPPSHR